MCRWWKEANFSTFGLFRVESGNNDHELRESVQVPLEEA